MKFVYKAKKGTETVTGEIESENSAQAIAKLEAMGYLPIKVEAHGKKLTGLPSDRLKKIPAKQLNIFTRQLASMVRSKVQVLRAFDLLCAESRHPQMKILLGYIRNDIRQGKQLSEALAGYPKYFSRIYVNMIASGEKGGVLEAILARLVEFSEREESLRSQIRSALAYPILMAIVGILSVIVMLTFVMPKLIGLFTDMGQDLPVITKILISASSFMRSYWAAIIFGLCALIFIVKKLKIIEKNRIVIDRIMLRIPIVGKSIKTREIARFSRTLSLLLEHKTPIRDAVTATIPTMGNRALEESLKRVTADLGSGATVSQSLSKTNIFPGFVVGLIAVGEESGNLDESFREIASSFEKDLESEIKVISSLIEPLLILAIGLVVGFIIMAMLLPIFEMNLR